MRQSLATMLAMMAVFFALPGIGQETIVPGADNVVSARFPGGATAVTVDVSTVSCPSGACTVTQIMNDLAATRLQLDAANTDTWFLDLEEQTGYPVDCAEKLAFARFRPDASDCVTSPDECVVKEIRIGGRACFTDENRSVSTTYTSTVVGAQGINSVVLNFFLLRGENPIRWKRYDFAVDDDFSSIDGSMWVVYFYSSTGDVPRVQCTVPTTTDPSVTLPSSVGCSGN